MLENKWNSLSAGSRLKPNPHAGYSVSFRFFFIFCNFLKIVPFAETEFMESA